MGWVPPTLYFATYEWAKKARVFVHGILSQPSAMFVGKTWEPTLEWSTTGWLRDGSDKMLTALQH
jgi:hypothetical protein